MGEAQAILGTDYNERYGGIDAVTGALEVIDYEHHEIHAGEHYEYSDHVELADAASQAYLLTTPDTTKMIHLLTELDGSAITQFELYESADRTGTTAQTAVNNNRNSSNTPGLTIHKGTSAGTTDGTRIRYYKAGSSTNRSRTAAGTRAERELVLKQNTKYLLKITSGSAANLCNVRLSWYEHTAAN